MAQSVGTSSSTGPTVVVSSDRMHAYVRIPADCPSSQVHTAGLMQLVRDSGLPTGDDTATMLDQAVGQFHDCPRELRVTVGQGVAPRRGADGRIEWQAGFGPDAAADHPSLADGPIDYYECSRFVSCREGQHLATLVPPEPGQPGFDIYGKRLAPTPGRPYPLRPDPSVRIAGDGRVLAERSGLVTCGTHTIHISPILEVAEGVDFSTGNVRFDGSVMIGQGIRDRFQVEATEDVVVGGLVEAAHVTCGRMLRADGGIAGRDIGTIQVGGDAVARYLVGVKGSVRGDLEVVKEIIHCQLQVGGALELRGGTIIGGHLCLANKVEVGELGSDAGVATELRLGHVRELTDALNRLGVALPPIDERTRQLRERLEMLSGFVEDQQARQARDQVADALRRLIARREKIVDKLAALTERFNTACRIELTVYKTIHPGVALMFPKARLEFHTPMDGPVTFRRHRDGRIRADSAAGREMSINAFARVLRTSKW